MINNVDFQPNWLSPPGDTIKDIIRHRTIELNRLSEVIGLSLSDLSEVLNGELAISEEIAKKLEFSVGGSFDFWINREKNYRIHLSRLEQDWFKNLPVRDFIKQGWITKENTSIKEIFHFFEVSNLFQWNRKFSNLSQQVAFRKSLVFDTKLGATAGWLQMGELLARRIKLQEWDKHKLLKALPQIRNLSTERTVSEFLPLLRQIFSECGIALVVLKTPPGCPVSGLTKFLDNGSPLVLLSFRYLTDDQFWFTIFHEIGHLILHENTLNIEGREDPRDSLDDRELEANEFAEEALIPEEFRKQMLTLKLDKFSIARFAKKIGVSPGIIVGQLQYMGRTKFNYFNQLKRRYQWIEINNTLS